MSAAGKPECAKCRFFDRGDLECRKNAPTLEGWPNVLPDQWCGGFEPSPHAICGFVLEGHFPLACVERYGHEGSHVYGRATVVQADGRTTIVQAEG